jgi:hypothetical protein
MLAPHLEEEVRWLLAMGKLSQRTIARQTGVSRGTVNLIAGGRRSDPSRNVAPWDDEPLQPVDPPQRCPSCGGWVYMPCRLCSTRELVERQKRDRAGAASPFLLRMKRVGPLGLALKPDHQQRYEEVRRQRMNLGIVDY